MTDLYTPSNPVIGHHPLHAILASFPMVCFVGALLTDLAYWQSADMQWANFSAWLITIGLVMGGFAVLAGIIDYLVHRRIHERPVSWPYVIGTVLALSLSLLNAFIHSRDAWTSVVPTGLALSAIVSVIVVVTAWIGASRVYRPRVGVAYNA